MPRHPFSPFDLAFLLEKGISGETASRQWQALGEGKRFVQLNRPATRGDGIRVLSTDEVAHFANRYRLAAPALPATKFVPASGAASRMFQCLEPVRQGGAPDTAAMRVLSALATGELALGQELASAMAAAGDDLSRRLTAGEYALVANWLLDPSGLDLARRAKALVPFHRTPGGVRTALDEHLADAAVLTSGRVHFTVAPEARKDFERHLGGRYAEDGPVSLSEQSSASQTLALGGNGELLRDDQGLPVLRPGGHGALLANLAGQDGRLLFVQNVDNVLPEGSARSEALLLRMAMGGLLLETQEKIAFALQMLSKKTPTPGDLEGVEGWARETLGFAREPRELAPAGRLARLLGFLCRPLRVAGMVANQGEPGGGPFWTQGKDGETRLQIVEAVEIDAADPGQRAIAAAASHFNPVDLVLSWTRPEGGSYDLAAFCDPQAYLIAEKSFAGQPIRILEHPGLWNGGMAHWNTLLVELPAGVFQPVKTVVDLLRDSHRGPVAWRAP